MPYIYTLKQCSTYSDETLITTVTQQSLIRTLQRLTNQSIHFWLIVNSQKTEYLRCSKSKSDLNDVDVDSKYLEQVKSYKYFGSVVSGDNSIEEEEEEEGEVKERVAMDIKVYHANQNIF